MFPVGPMHPFPPAAVVVQRHGAWRAFENERTGDEHRVVGLWRSGRELFFDFFPLGFSFGGGDVARGLDEAAELGVRDFGGVHPESIDFRTVDREFVIAGLWPHPAHIKLAAGNPDHALWPRFFRPLRGIWEESRLDVGRSRAWRETLGIGFAQRNRHEESKGRCSVAEEERCCRC